MSNQEIQNSDTDNQPKIVESDVSVSNTDNDTTTKKNPYEVVFFARYNYGLRPSNDEIHNFFSKYGEIDHINCPENRSFAFIFMNKLSTDAEQRRTRNTIQQIIRDMTPETRFHITVASSRPRFPQNYQPNNRRYNNRPYNGTGGYSYRPSNYNRNYHYRQPYYDRNVSNNDGANNRHDKTNQSWYKNNRSNSNQLNQSNQSNQTNQTNQFNQSNQFNQTNQSNQFNQSNQTNQFNQPRNQSNYGHRNQQNQQNQNYVPFNERRRNNYRQFNQ